MEQPAEMVAAAAAETPAGEVVQAAAPVSAPERAVAPEEEASDVEGSGSDDGEGSSLKMCMMNLSKSLREKRLATILKGMGCSFAKLRKVGLQRYAHVEFESEEQKQAFLERMRGVTLPGSNKPVLIKKKERQRGVNRDMARKASLVNSAVPDAYLLRAPTAEEAQAERDDPALAVLASVTPYWRLPYDEQLKVKTQVATNVLDAMRGAIREGNAAMADRINAATGANALQLGSLIASPTTQGYRNKCSFTIGRDSAGHPTVGFSLGQYIDGITAVGPPDKCPHVHPLAIAAASRLTAHIRRSTLIPFEKKTHAGFWRQLLVRTTETSEVMLSVQVKSVEVSPEQLQKEKDALIKLFFDQDNDDPSFEKVPVHSLYWQEHNGMSNAAPANTPQVLLHGAPAIKESLLDLKFSISPDSFFQVNTPAAALLYQSVLEFASRSGASTVLDVCCGTGTISLIMARQFATVIGVDISEPAILDAKANADANGITNVEFICDKAESALPRLVMSRQLEKTVAICDPPRGGLHPKAIQALRKCPAVQHVVYVSCGPDSLVRDTAFLCRAMSKRAVGHPFRPVAALAVDLFPHTPLLEMVVLFEREVGNIEGKSATSSGEALERP